MVGVGYAAAASYAGNSSSTSTATSATTSTDTTTTDMTTTDATTTGNSLPSATPAPTAGSTGTGIVTSGGS